MYNVTDQEYKDYLSELDIDSLHEELSKIESDSTRQLSMDLFTRYNVIDALLIKQLDDKLNLIRIVTSVAYKAGINFEDVSSPIKTWDSIVHNTLLAENVVVPQPGRSRAQPFDGAYVKEPVPGFYHNVSSIDATSLYPSIIITNNISPETYIGNVGTTIDDFFDTKSTAVFGDDEYVVTPAGARYSKKKRGILPRLMIQYMADRKTVKNEMLALEQEYENTKEDSLLNRIAALDALQMAIKILLNSCYGATANEHFRFFKHDHAASITLSGQYLLMSAENKVGSKINEKFKTEDEPYVIYCDTDSIYFCLDPIIKKFGVAREKTRETLEKLTSDIITPMVNDICQECCDKMGSYENKISFKLEVAAPEGAIFCVLPGTRITVNNVDYNIEDYHERFVDDGKQTTLSWDRKTGQMVSDVIRETFTKHYSGKIYRFTGENGKTVSVTADHIMFVRRSGVVLEIPARDVILSDELIYVERGTTNIK